MRGTLSYVMVAFSIIVGFGGCTLTFRPIPDAVVVTAAPPRTVVEVRTVNTAPNQVWIDGYWGWSNNTNNWQWNAGRWETQRVGYYWVAPRHNYSGGKHYYSNGGWTQSSTKGYSKGKGSNQGYKSQKCPKGYHWSDGACRTNAKKQRY